MRELPSFGTVNEFSMHIEKIASSKKISHLDAVLLYCEEYMIEPADIAPKMSRSLKAKVEHNFRELNYLPKMAQIDM
jgi:hypothetical protein